MFDPRAAEAEGETMVAEYQRSAVDGESAGGWYLYRFETDLRCAIPDACTFDHPLYRGKSNEPLRRLLEHAKDQPWWPYVTGWSVDPQTYDSNEAVLAAEKAAILAELPLANKALNENNAHRLDFGKRVPSPAGPRRPARQSVVAQREPGPWGWLWTKPSGYAALWLVLAGVLWVTTGHGGWDGVAAGVGGASASFVIPWVGDAWTKLTKRRRRKRRR